MNFLRLLTNYYKIGFPKFAKTLIRLRDEVTIKDCTRFFADIKRQGIDLPQKFYNLQPTVNYFRNVTKLHLLRTIGVRNFATKKRGSGGGDCKKLGVKKKSKKKKKKKHGSSGGCGKMPSYSCKTVKKSCSPSKKSKKKDPCKKKDKKKKKDSSCGKQKMTFVVPPPCSKSKSSSKKKKDPCKKKKDDPCKKKKKKDPCKKKKEDPCKKKKKKKKKDPCKKQDPCKKKKKKKDPCKKEDPCKKKKDPCKKKKKDPCKKKKKDKKKCKSSCDSLPCDSANKKPCSATCRRSKKDECKQSNDPTRFILKNQDIDVVNELKCEKAYNNSENFANDLDEYFCDEKYKNQQFYKTHKYTFYDALRYTVELQEHKGDAKDCH